MTVTHRLYHLWDCSDHEPSQENVNVRTGSRSGDNSDRKGMGRVVEWLIFIDPKQVT